MTRIREKIVTRIQEETVTRTREEIVTRIRESREEGGCGADRAVGELEVDVLDAGGGEGGGVVRVRVVEPHLRARACARASARAR